MPVLISNTAELQSSHELLVKRRVEPMSTVIGPRGEANRLVQALQLQRLCSRNAPNTNGLGSPQARGALGRSYFAVSTTDCRKLEAAQNPSRGYRWGNGGPQKFTCPRSYYKPVPPSHPTNVQSHLTTRGYSITDVHVIKYFTHVPFCSFRGFPPQSSRNVLSAQLWV